MNADRIAPYSLRQNDTIISFLPSGDPFSFTAKNISIKLYQSNPLYGGMGNIWLRIYHENGMQAFPLIGLNSESSFHVGEHEVSYRGRVSDIDYVLNFRLADDGHWFYDLKLKASGSRQTGWKFLRHCPGD